MPRVGLARPKIFLQAKAFLLLAVFLSAGTSLPSLDAVVYHQGGADLQRWRTHVEPAGGCLNHADHCSLGRTAPGSGAVAQLTSEPRTEPLQPEISPHLPASPHIGTDRGATTHSRAPPILRSV